ncbi:MAG: hypothetical protein ACJZ4Z_01480 [Candidatus Thalassarchaeaceae archaeon]
MQTITSPNICIDENTPQKNIPEGDNTDYKSNNIDFDWGSISPEMKNKINKFTVHDVEDYRVTPQRPLHTHYKGFTTLNMVMYVQRVDFIVALFDKHGIDKANIIIGDSVVTKNRSSTDPETFLRLAELIEENRLTIRVPKNNRTFHEKWILAEKDGEFKDIFGTANLTASGSVGRKQSNQVRIQRINGNYADSDRYNDLMEKFTKWYLDTSEIFLQDLIDLLQKEDQPRIQIVERWVSYTGSSANADSTRVNALIHEFQEKALGDSINPDIIVTELTTEANDAILEDVIRILAPAGLRREGRTIIADTRPFLDYRVSTFPLMNVNEKVTLRVGNSTINRTADVYDIEEIRRGIESIHSYVETIDRSSCKNPRFAKMSMYEIMLYFLTSPFHHSFMQESKKIFGYDYERGPKPLAIYGNTKNGKTYLLKYCTRLLTGKNDTTNAYDDDDFSTTKVKNILSWSSLFPIIYDDISDGKWGKSYMDQIIRSYWDNWWQRDRNHSQLIVTSNRRIPQGQLKGRMKEVVMDARFEDTTDNIRHVTSIMNKENNIFLYFSKLYIEYLQKDMEDVFDHTDAMSIGRKVMQDLYEMTDIPIPNFFPLQSIEKIVDNNSLSWLGLINDGDVRWKISPQKELHLFFTNNEDRYEVGRQMDLIPESFGPKRRGEKIILPVPSEFINWLNGSISSFGIRKPSRNLKKLLRQKKNW